eukprot:4864516-Alexandrium_andersonii.AAC.1
MGVQPSRLASVSKDRMMDILAAARTVSWLDRHMHAVGLGERISGTMRDKVALIFQLVLDGRAT